MDDAEELIRASLAKWKPAEVQLYQGEELYRKIDVPTKGKRWAAIVPVIMKLEWTRLELRSRAGAVLDVITDTTQEEAAAEAPSAPEPVTREERQLALMLRAQDQALKHRTQESQMALTAAATILDKVANIIGGLVDLQTMLIQNAKQSAPPATKAEKVDELQEAMQLLQTITPLLGSGSAGKPENTTKGD